MGCIVEQVLLENGEASALYEALANDMESGAALETYLELTQNKKGYIKMFGTNKQGEVNQTEYLNSPKFKLANFESYQEQVDVMDFLLDEMLDAFGDMKETESKYTLTGINTNPLANDPSILPKVISKIRTKIGMELASAEANQYTDRQVELLRNAIIELPSYIGTKGMLRPLGAKLKDMGIHIRISEDKVAIDESQELSNALLEDSEGEFDAERHDLGQELIYAMDILEMPTLNSVLPELKLYLRSLRRVKKGYQWSESTAADLIANPQNVYEATALGTFRPNRHEIVMGKLFGILKGTQSIDEMGMRIKNSLTSNPDLIPVYEQLMDEQPINIPHIGKYNPLAVALFTLAKQDYDMISLVERDGKTLTVMDANSSSIRNKIKDAWSETIEDVQNSGVESLSRKAEALAKYLKPTQVIKSMRGNRVSGKTIPNPNVKGLNAYEDKHLSEAARQFRLAGFAKFTKGNVRDYINAVLANPKKFRKGSKKLTPAEIVKTTLEKVAKSIYKGEDIYAKSSDAYGESKLLNLLSNAVGESATDIHVGAHLSNRGTIVHAYNMGSEAQDTWKRLQEITEAQEAYLRDPMYRNTLLLDILTQDSEANAEFRVQSLDTLSNNTKRGSGLTYGKLSTFDALTTRAQLFFNAKAAKGYFNAMSPTQGDNGNLTIITVPKLNYKEGMSTQKVVDKGRIVSTDISSWIRNHLEAELTRIIKAPLTDGFVNYSKSKKGKGNAARFNLFDKLNAVEVDFLALDTEDLGSTIDVLYDTAEEQFIEMLEDDAKFYAEKGVYSQNDNGSFKANNKYLNKLTKAEMDTFLANNFIYGYEQVLFYVGDPAFYKEGSVSGQKININKRFRLPFTPGVKFATNPEVAEAGPMEENANNTILNDSKQFFTGMPKKFRLKIIEEVSVKAEMSNVYNILGDGFTGKMDIADGQGYISVKRYLQSLASRGIHTDELVKLVEELDAWTKNPKTKITSQASLQVLKHFYFKIQEAKEGLMAPLSLKYAVLPAIPSLFERKNADGDYLFPGMAKISKELNGVNAQGNRDGMADEVVMESAVKVGIRKATSLNNLDTAGFIDLDNDGMRVPQVTPTTKKTATRFGSQIRKLIMANHNPDVDILGESGTAALDNYNSAISLIVSSLGEKVVSDYVNEHGEISMERIVSSILRELEYNPFKNAEYYQEALRTINEDGDPLMPTNYPTVKNTIDSSIAAEFRKKIAKMKLPGYSAIQVSSMGTEFSKNNISVESDLKFVSIAKNGRELTGDALTRAARDIAKGLTSEYTITPAEVRVSSKYFLNRLEEISKEHVKGNMTQINEQVKEFTKGLNKKLSAAAAQEARTSYRNQLIQNAIDTRYKSMVRSVSENGEVSIDLVKEAGLDELVLYRIPTQGKNSMLPAKIKDFLPSQSDATIQVPGEIVEQSGSDFDVDKVYIEMHKFGFEKGGFKKQSHRSGPQGEMGELANIDETSNEVQSVDQAQAYIMEYHKAILSNPAYVAELLLPNRTTELSRMAGPESEGGLNLGAEVQGLLSSTRLQEGFRNNNKSGNDMIGIASISSVMHAMAKHIGAEFRTPVYMKGIMDRATKVSLGETWNLNKENQARISDEIAEVQNAALDNANDPLLGHLNINEYTASSALFIISAGHGIEYATKFLNAPILRELAEIYPTYLRGSSPNNAHKQAMKAVLKKYKIKLGMGKGYKSQLPSFDKNDAERLLRSTTQEDMKLSLQIFSELRGVGDSLGQFQTWMNLDSTGTPTTAAGIISRYADMATIVGTSSWAIEHSKVDTGMTRLLPILTGKDKFEAHPLKVNQEQYIKTHLATMETFLLNVPLQVLKESSPTATQQYQFVLREASDTIGYLDQFQSTKVLSAYDTFVATNSKSVLDNTSSIAQRMNGDYTDMVDPTNMDSTANLLKSYREQVEKKGDVENAFTENLTVVNQDGKHFVTFRNTVARALTGETRKEMMFFYEDLMDGDNIERALAKSLADYAMLFYGYSKSVNSFMDFISPRAHQDFMGAKEGANNVSLPNFFRSVQGTMNQEGSYTKASVDNFIVQYMKNNISTVPLQIHSLDLLSEGNPPFYAKGMVNGKWHLYQFNGTTYTKQGGRGIPNLAVEYHAQPSLFNDSTADMEAKAARDKADSDNKQAIDDLAKEQSNFKSTAVKGTVRQYLKNIINLDEFTVSNDADANAYVTELVKRLEKNKETAKDIKYIKEIYEGVIQDTSYVVKKNDRVNYLDVFKANIEDSTVQFLEYSDLNILKKIKDC